jgi:hypothetical protein
MSIIKRSIKLNELVEKDQRSFNNSNQKNSEVITITNRAMDNEFNKSNKILNSDKVNDMTQVDRSNLYKNHFNLLRLKIFQINKERKLLNRSYKLNKLKKINKTESNSTNEKKPSSKIVKFFKLMGISIASIGVANAYFIYRIHSEFLELMKNTIALPILKLFQDEDDFNKSEEDKNNKTFAAILNDKIDGIINTAMKSNVVSFINRVSPIKIERIKDPEPKPFKPNKSKSKVGKMSKDKSSNLKIKDFNEVDYETAWNNLRKLSEGNWEKSLVNNVGKEFTKEEREIVKHLPKLMKVNNKEKGLEILKKINLGKLSRLSYSYNLLNPKMNTNLNYFSLFKNKLDLKYRKYDKEIARSVKTMEDNSMRMMGNNYMSYPNQNFNFDQYGPSDYTITDPQLMGVQPNLVAFYNEMKRYVPNAKLTSGRYDHGKYTKGGSISMHWLGQAIDFGINSNANTGVREFLYSPQGKLLMNKYGLGFLDESLSSNSKWGGAYHVGMDPGIVSSNRASVASFTRSYYSHNYNPKQIAPVQEIEDPKVKYNFKRVTINRTTKTDKTN